ncbi:MurR/RpiR family transcriptional regulator [Metabacillus arenae]|uniref:MurR/RpiR family transcriptional regulator n=1 Tax=Metabacillus arenae TaxID=2771434 RepID=A0A926S275_9BACI|nr:MurR/RpiR family transcriptional regulator [Metabacillus arenae]MBD1381724.1 MurR/RpiR family transcriptional regulator [Metabacillus arenae]
MMKFEERVHKFEYKLNDTDDQIVEYIIRHKKEITQLSIQALAAEVYTVPNTISRLCKKLDYDGYSQLKNGIKEEVKNDKIKDQNDIRFNLNKTYNLIDMEKMTSITKIMSEAHRVLFFAVGDSVPFCEIMVKNLKMVGKRAEFYLHRHEMMSEINQLDKKDVLFIISFSGETSQVIEMANLANERGVQLVSLTHFNRNTLQKIATINLFCYAPKVTINGYNATDRTSVMIILRVLSECYWKQSNAVYKYT